MLSLFVTYANLSAHDHVTSRRDRALATREYILYVVRPHFLSPASRGPVRPKNTMLAALYAVTLAAAGHEVSPYVTLSGGGALLNKPAPPPLSTWR